MMILKKIIKKILVTLFDLETNRLFRAKINKIAAILNVREKEFDQKIIKRYIKKWKPLKLNVNILWYKVYSSVLNIEDDNFIPEDIYYSIVEPHLNNKILSKAYSDKNFYDMLYDKNLFPTTIIRNIDGTFYDKEYNSFNLTDEVLHSYLTHFTKIIIKPAVDSGGGHNVIVLNRNENEFYVGNEILSVNYLKEKFVRNYIIQDYLVQHDFFSGFNPSSLNTMRVFTYRSVTDYQVHILHTILRVGRPGSNVDNQASGGISINISQQGFLNKFAIDKNGNKSFSINGIDLIDNIKVPFIELIKICAIAIAKKNIHHRLLGLDFTVDSNQNIRLIEINNQNNEINFYQMNSGPLFGQFTDEVIEYCTRNRKSFVLDFEV